MRKKLEVLEVLNERMCVKASILGVSNLRIECGTAR